VTTVQHQFKTFGKDLHDKNSITSWYNDLLNKGCICKRALASHQQVKNMYSESGICSKPIQVNPKSQHSTQNPNNHSMESPL